MIISEDYKNLLKDSNDRKQELSKMFSPVILVTDYFGSLICRVTAILGTTPPASAQDKVIRDLMADAFDFLWEWRRPLLEGRIHVAWPLARRAYESISTMSICAQDSKFAERWEKGNKKITNSDVRKALAKAAIPESEETLKQFYNFFSKASHPNRDLIANRYLGEGNEFVLGSAIPPDSIFLTDHCIKLIQIWFWLTAIISYFYRREVLKVDAAFPQDHINTVEEARRVIISLSKKLNDLLEESQTEHNSEATGFKNA